MGERDTRNDAQHDRGAPGGGIHADASAWMPDFDLRPQLERLERLMLRSEGLDPAALTFAVRPLWQLEWVRRSPDEAEPARVGPENCRRASPVRRR